MGRLTSAIVKARKLVRDKEKANSIHSNQLIICTEYNKELTGELVIIINRDI